MIRKIIGGILTICLVASTLSASVVASQGEILYEATHSHAEVFYTKNGNKYAQVMVELKNTSSVPLYFGSGSYDLTDQNGRLLTSKSHISATPQVVSPGELAYYYDLVNIDDEPSVNAVGLSLRPNVKKATVPKKALTVSEAELYQQKYMITYGMKGFIENTTNEKCSMVFIGAIFYDDNGKPIAQASNVITEELSPGAKIGFTAGIDVLSKDTKLSDLKTFRAYAYEYQIQL